MLNQSSDVPSLFSSHTSEPDEPGGPVLGVGPLAVRSPREQLSRAARVQRSLLPDVSRPVGEFELACFYLPCEPLAGDFYDVARTNDAALVLVADVMGHGAEAALITMLVKAAFADAVETTTDPGPLLGLIGKRLGRLVHDRAYVAAALLRLDVGSPAVRLANAGLPRPFLLRSSEGKVEELPIDGRPLGLAANGDEAPLGEISLTLSRDDVLLLASDGLGSVEGRRGELFQDGRLHGTLASLVGRVGRDVIDGLVASASSFGRGRRFPDDINLIAVSRTNGHA